MYCSLCIVVDKQHHTYHQLFCFQLLEEFVHGRGVCWWLPHALGLRESECSPSHARACVCATAAVIAPGQQGTCQFSRVHPDQCSLSIHTKSTAGCSAAWILDRSLSLSSSGMVICSIMGLPGCSCAFVTSCGHTLVCGGRSWWCCCQLGATPPALAPSKLVWLSLFCTHAATCCCVINDAWPCRRRLASFNKPFFGNCLTDRLFVCVCVADDDYRHCVLACIYMYCMQPAFLYPPTAQL